MPTRRKNESESAYIKRAVPIIKKEHPGKSMKQILGQAYGMAKAGKKHTKKGGKK